jgi:hypothetical protein
MMPRHRPSDQYRRFEQLADSATTPELLELASHKSPVVRYYSLSALSYRDDARVFKCLTEHLKDTATFDYWFFDMGSKVSVGRHVANDFLKVYCIRTPLADLNHSEIHTLALNPSVPIALFALARFRQDGDTLLLRDRFRETILGRVSGQKHSSDETWCAFRAIREFPSPAFFPILQESGDSLVAGHENIHRQQLFQAIAQYSSDSASVLLERLFTAIGTQGIRRAGVQFDLATALIRARDPLLTRLMSHHLDLDVRNLLGAGSLVLRQEEYLRAP